MVLVCSLSNQARGTVSSVIGKYFYVVVATYQLDGLGVDTQPLVGFCLPVVLGMVG
jgi:hypothetical protein